MPVGHGHDSGPFEGVGSRERVQATARTRAQHDLEPVKATVYIRKRDEEALHQCASAQQSANSWFC